MNSKLLFVLILFVTLLSNLLASPEIFNQMDFNGEVGVKYNFISNDNNSEGDISVSNFDFSLTLEPAEMISAYLCLLYDNEMESLEVDAAYAKVRLMEEYSLAVTAGSFYQATSIALDYSNFISFPYTYTFTELSELALMGEVTWNNITLKTSIYKENNDSEEGENDIESVDDSNLDAFVLNLSTEQEFNDLNFLLSSSYISNLRNTGNFEIDESKASADDEIRALSIGSSITWLDFSLLGEYVMTLDEFIDEKPSVLYTELSYSLMETFVIAGSYAISQNSENILNESAIATIVKYTFMENDFSSATLGAEYLIEKNYDDNDENTLTVKLSLDF